MHPILFHLFDYPVKTYGVLMSLGMLAGLSALLLQLHRKRVRFEKYLDIIYIMLGAGLLGGRSFYIATHWHEFSSMSRAHLFYFWEGGVSLTGGIITALPILLLYLHIKRLPFWETTDLFTAPFALALAFVKLGCLGAGCCHGIACDLPWAVKSFSSFTSASLRGQLLHPVQAYESLFLLGIFIILWKLQKSSNLRTEGKITLLFALSYGLLKICLDPLRADREFLSFLPMIFSLMQYLIVGIMIAIFTAWMIYQRKRR